VHAPAGALTWAVLLRTRAEAAEHSRHSPSRRAARFLDPMVLVKTNYWPAKRKRAVWTERGHRQQTGGGKLVPGAAVGWWWVARGKGIRWRLRLFDERTACRTRRAGLTACKAKRGSARPSTSAVAPGKARAACFLGRQRMRVRGEHLFLYFLHGTARAARVQVPMGRPMGWPVWRQAGGGQRWSPPAGDVNNCLLSTRDSSLDLRLEPTRDVCSP